MSSLFFWKGWNPAYRFTYVFSGIVFIISLIGFVTAWLKGLGNVVDWDVLSELNQLPVTFRTFSDGLFNYPVNGKAYAVSEQFVAGSMQVRPGVATVFLVGIGFGFVLLLSAVTRFDRLRYLISMAVLILGLAFFRWDMLDVPGLGGNYLFLLLTFAVVSLSYYFHAFRPNLPIGVRLAAFGLLVILVFAVLSALSPVGFPAMAVVSYGMPVLVVLSAGFIFFIAPEIVAGLVWITSVGRSDINGPSVGVRRTLGVRNFLFVGFLYVVNLVLVWLKNTRAIDWDILIISPFLLYLLSVVVGIWGFRRLVSQQDVVSFRDSGAFLYAGFAVLTTLTMAYAFATANDPLVELFEDVIVYTHLCMGLVFIAYVLINFWPIYQQHLPVHRVLYKPKRLELVLFRVVGLFGIVSLLSTGQFFTVRQGMAGYFNGLGDYYTATNEPVSANAYYQLALEKEFQNHKSNYALATLARLQNNASAAAFYFQQALLKQPNPEDYAGLSQTYLQTNLFFEAIKALQRGIRAFPANGELQNNLGYLYARTSVADSAYYYLKSAAGNAHRQEIPMSNLLAFYARNPLVLQADSTLAQRVDESAYESYQANALALRLVAGTDTNQTKQPDWLPGEAKAQTLSVGRFARLYNYAVATNQPDSALTGMLRRLSENPANQDITDDLLLARAVAEYNQHNHPAAFGLMSQLAEGTPKDAALYWSITGLWMLEQGLYPKAAEIFGNNTDTTSAFYQAVAFTKAHDPVVAQLQWEKVAKTDPAINALKQVYYQERTPTSDVEKAFYVTYRIGDPNRNTYLATIQDPALKTVAGAALINTLLEQSDGPQAQRILTTLPDAIKSNPVAYSLRTVAGLRLAAFQRNVAVADALASQPVLPRFQAEQRYWLGQAYEQTGQSGKAGQQYQQALQLAPLNARIVAGAAQFAQQQNQPKTGYGWVLTALPFNENNAGLLKTYVTLCLSLSLPDYAETGLARLRVSTTPADYQAFLTTYQEKVASIEKSREKFLQ